MPLLNAAPDLLRSPRVKTNGRPLLAGERLTTAREVAAFAAVALLLTFTLSIRRKVITDEDPFVASAALLLRTGALPYRDYLYYHMPTLVFVYAGLFALTGHLLLAARAFNAACGAAAVTAVYWVARRWLAPLGRRGRWAALGVGLLYLFDPGYTYTSGQAWNHDFPTLCCLLALLCLMRGIGRPAAGRWALACGVGVGLAVTSRLTYAVVPPAFVAFVALYPGLTAKRRLWLLAWLAAGVLLAAAPTAWVWSQSPANAWFGNFDYPALSTRYHLTHDYHHKKSFTVGARAVYVIVHVFARPGYAIGLAIFGVALAAGLRGRAPWRDARACELAAIALLAGLMGASSFAPSPMFEQYLYGPVPFVILGIARGLSMAPHLLDRPGLRRAFAACVILTVAAGAVGYRGVAMLPHYRRWVPVWVHDTGVRVAALTGGRRVLTLELIYPLEGKLPVFESLVASRFVIRAAPYLSPGELQRRKMIDRRGVLDLYRANPQLPVLTSSVYADIEDALARLARERGARAVPLWNRGTLWLPAAGSP